MRILIPILGFARQGGYRVLSELANEWIRMGHECDFLVPSTSDDPYFPTKANVIHCNSKGLVSARDLQKSTTGFDNIISLYSGLNKIGFEYDVILANHSLTSWVVRLAKCRDSLKVYYIQAYEPDYYKWFADPLKHILAKLSYRLDLLQVSNSSSYKEQGVFPVRVIPPGIDLEIFFEKIRAPKDSADGTITIGTIGRLEAYKGTSTAIAAYRKVRSAVPSLKMKVAFGNVSPADDLEIVEVKGDKALADFYRSIDALLVSCYSQHGAPHYPVIEAMACGTPVIHTDYYPGDAMNSWIANTPSVSDVATALEDFLSASEEVIAVKTSNGRRCVEEHLSWESVAKAFLDTFSCANRC